MKTTIISIFAALALTACGTSADKKAAAAQEQAAEVTEAAAADNSGFRYERGKGVIEYDGATMGRNIRPDAELPVVIDFNATWCGPCQRFKPTFDKVASEYDGAIFLSVDVDQNPAAAEQFEVSGIPQITILMPDGTTSTQVGLMDEPQFRQFLGI